MGAPNTVVVMVKGQVRQLDGRAAALVEMLSDNASEINAIPIGQVACHFSGRRVEMLITRSVPPIKLANDPAEG